MKQDVSNLATYSQVRRLLSLLVISLAGLTGCVFVQRTDLSNQDSRTVFHLRQNHGIFFPMMMGEDDLYLYLQNDLLLEGTTIPIRSTSAKATVCTYSHPNQRCTEKVTGKVTVVRVSSSWIDLHLTLSTRDKENRVDWSIDRGFAFAR